MGGSLDKPWREPTDWNKELDKELQKEVADMQKKRKEKGMPNILVLGPVSSGKSSFINSVITVCKGRIAKETKVRDCKASCTREFVQTAATDESIHFVMFDTFGVAENAKCGFNVDDLVAVIGGHVKSGYTFKDDDPIRPDNEKYYIAEPREEDKVHSVVFLLSAYDIHKRYLSKEYTDKLKDLQKKVEDLGIQLLVVLTKCDLVCETPSNLYKHLHIYDLTENAREMFAVQLNDVFPLKNYNTEIKLDPMVNIPILFALKQILYNAYDYQDRHGMI